MVLLIAFKHPIFVHSFFMHSQRWIKLSKDSLACLCLLPLVLPSMQSWQIIYSLAIHRASHICYSSTVCYSTGAVGCKIREEFWECVE